MSESVTFKIEKNPFNATKQSAYMYKMSNVTFQRGLTILVGCNGAGKTTLLNDLKYRCGQDGIDYIDYDNLQHGGSSTLDAMINLGQGSVQDIARYWSSSEGERIHINIERLLHKIIQKTKDLKPGDNMFIFGDAIDSGSSIDHMSDVVETFKLVVEDMKNRNDLDIYFIVSANSYEMARHNKCFAVQKCEYIEFTDYEDYRTFIMKSRDLKDKRDYNYVEKISKPRGTHKKSSLEFKREKKSSGMKPKHSISIINYDPDDEESDEEDNRNKWKDIHETDPDLKNLTSTRKEVDKVYEYGDITSTGSTAGWSIV